jgi:hypothetical protein
MNSRNLFVKLLSVITLLCIVNWFAWFIDSWTAGGMPNGGPITWFHDAVGADNGRTYVVGSHGYERTITGSRYRVICWLGVTAMAGWGVALISILTSKIIEKRTLGSKARNA